MSGRAARAAPLAAYPFFLAQALCLALFACAFNLLVGYSGLLSFGHALFFGSASYFAAHAAKVCGWPPEAAILAATLAAGLLGLVAGALSIRSQGIYFSMITLALAQMAYFIALQSPSHPWRGRHSGRAARKIVRADRSRQ